MTWQIVLTVWIILIPLLLFMIAQSHDVITMGDVWVVTLFAPIMFLIMLTNMEHVVWRRGKKAIDE